MQRAIDAVIRKEMGWLKASKTFGVPQATLRRRARGKNLRVTGSKKGLGRYVETFPSELEQELVSYIKRMESCLFGLSCDDVRKLAFQLAERNNIEHRFNKQNKMAGWDWLRDFRLRNPSISLRTPEATSAGRAQGFNKPQVKRFYETLDNVLRENNIPSERIWNVDESGLSSVQRPQKVFASKGKKQVGSLTSAEKGQHVSVVCCVSSTGTFIPPALIYSRKRWKNELIDGAPTGTLGLFAESGWMTGELFLSWMKHFQKYVNASQENKVLLLLDGHSSHKQLDVLTYAKHHGIILLAFPPSLYP